MKIEYTKYLVGYDSTGKHVEIYLEGNEPSEGHRTVASFEANPVEGVLKGDKDFDTGGDHILVAASKKALLDLGIEDFQGTVFEDKASNAPKGDSYILTHEDRARAVRENITPADKQAELSANLDKAEAKLEKADTNKGSAKKNDARHRTDG